MAIEKKLICCKTQANFDKLLEAGDIHDYSIVFIQDTQSIWTHGTYFSSLAKMLDDISGKQDKLTAGENITIEEIDGVLTITSADTTYGISLENNILTLTDSNSKTSTVDLSKYLDDTNTTYVISLSSGTLTLAGSDGSASTVSLNDYETVADATSVHDELQAGIDTKQDQLTAGENITIEASGNDLVIKSADTTYVLSLTDDTLTLTDSNGSASTADLSKYTSDANTTYTLDLSSNSLVLTGSDGSTATVDLSKYLDDTNTTYGISLASNILTLTGSDGNNTTVDLSPYTADENTTYVLALSGNTLTLTGSDGQTNTIDLSKYTADENTTYSIELASNVLTLVGSDGASTTVDLSQYTADTTYVLSLTDNTLALTDSGGGTSTVDLSKYMDDTDTTYSIDLASNTLSLIGSDGTATTVDLSGYAIDTKNTAGATSSTSKLYIIGATEQTENPETNTSGAYLEGTKVYDGNGDALATEESVDELNKTIEELRNEVAALTESYCFMVRDYGDSDPTAKMFYGTQEAISNVGKHMKLAVVRGQGDYDFLATNRLTLGEDGKTIMLDGSDGDFMVATDVTIYLYAEKIEASDGTLEIFGLGLTPLTLFGKYAVGYEPFAMACDAAVYCQLTSENTDHIAADDLRSQLHCIYNENIAGQYTAPTHDYFKETYKANGNGYASGGYTTLNNLLHAQAKNEDSATNYPWMALYYRFVEIWMAAAKCELGTHDINAVDLLGTGATCAATPSTSNWASSAISANSGFRYFDGNGSSVGITNIYTQRLRTASETSADYTAFGLDGTLYSCSLLPMLTPHRIIDRITANGNLEYINSIDNIFDEDGNIVTGIDLNTGEGMEPTVRYYVVRDCPGAESFSDGVMTGVVLCYFKVSCNDGVQYVASSAETDLTGGFVICKIALLLYRGFTWSTGHWIYMLGYHNVVHTDENGDTYLTAIYQRDPKAINPWDSSQSYSGNEDVTTDFEQGYDVDDEHLAFNDAWRKNTNPSVSLFHHIDSGGAQHTYVCSYKWHNNSQTPPSNGMKRVNASAFGGPGSSAYAAACSCVGSYSVALSNAVRGVSFALATLLG